MNVGLQNISQRFVQKKLNKKDKKDKKKTPHRGQKDDIFMTFFL